MKMLFFYADGSEVELVGKEFTQAGIPCEVRNTSPRQNAPPQAHSELWIRDDKDCHRALMLCVHLGIGFSKRPPKASFLEDLETAAAERSQRRR